MDNYFKRVYDLIYSPIVSPYNLLENAKLPNYEYVKYYKDNEGLLAEMKCEVPEQGTKIFYYYFDSKDYLQKIYVQNNDIKELLFERQTAIDEAKQDYYLERPLCKEVI